MQCQIRFAPEQTIQGLRVSEGHQKAWRILVFSLGLIACLVPGFSAHAAPTAAEARVLDGARWDALRKHLFEDREIKEGTGIVSLEAPSRAFDAARVSVTLRAIGAQ